MKVLVIEDEELAQKQLKKLLHKIDPSVVIMETLETVRASVDWLKNNDEPDLIFLDIQLADGESFDIFNQVEISSPVIFITAYDQYALKAFEVNSIDYLLKPLEKSQLEASLRKYQGLKQKFSNKSASLTGEQIDRILSSQQPEYKTRFITKTGDSIKYISIEDVSYFFSSQEITYLVAKEGKKYVIDYTLDDLIQVLDKKEFFRISRKYIAKISAIDQVRKYFNSRLKVTLNPPVDDDILISRVRVPEFLTWLEK